MYPEPYQNHSKTLNSAIEAFFWRQNPLLRFAAKHPAFFWNHTAEMLWVRAGAESRQEEGLPRVWTQGLAIPWSQGSSYGLGRGLCSSIQQEHLGWQNCTDPICFVFCWSQSANLLAVCLFCLLIFVFVFVLVGWLVGRLFVLLYTRSFRYLSVFTARFKGNEDILSRVRLYDRLGKCRVKWDHVRFHKQTQFFSSLLKKQTKKTSENLKKPTLQTLQTF